MYSVYLEYRGCNELLTKVSSLSQAKTLCGKLNSSCSDNFIVWYKKEYVIYDFDDWLCYMISSYNYTMFELLCFTEHYQNLLTFKENRDLFINLN